MKLLTKEEERAHYNATLKGGLLGGIGGLALAGTGVVFAHRRYHFFNQLTIPLKAFLITSGGTFTGIIGADHYSRAYEQQRNPLDRQFAEREKERSEAETSGMSWTERAMDFGRKERYKIVGGSWLASMVTAFALVNRNKYLSGQQKLVQARVYAQGLTLAVLVASAAFEISDKNNDEGKLWETVRVVDPNDPEHKRMIEKKTHKEDWEGQELWRDMVDAEEQRLKDRERGEKKLQHDKDKKNGKSGGSGKGKEESKKSDKKDDKDAKMDKAKKETRNEGDDEKTKGDKAENRDNSEANKNLETKQSKGAKGSQKESEQK